MSYKEKVFGEYTKTPSTIEQQIAILKERGCIIDDEAYAVKCLTNINYYRLAHYFAPFFEAKGKYKDGTRFETVMDIYSFDRKLRRLIMSFLEEIEIALRAYVSNYHALKYGALGYMNASAFDVKHNHQSFLSKVKHLEDINNKEDFVQHHKTKYGGVMPIWAAMELFSFGTLVYFFADMKEADKKEIASQYYGMNFRCLESRLLCLADLRNSCAHFIRLYDNPFRFAPKGSDEDYDHEPEAALYDYLIAARSLHPDKDKWDDEFEEGFIALVERYNMENRLTGYGFPENFLQKNPDEL